MPPGHPFQSRHTCAPHKLLPCRATRTSEQVQDPIRNLLEQGFPTALLRMPILLAKALILNQLALHQPVHVLALVPPMSLLSALSVSIRGIARVPTRSCLKTLVLCSIIPLPSSPCLRRTLLSPSLGPSETSSCSARKSKALPRSRMDVPSVLEPARAKCGLHVPSLETENGVLSSCGPTVRANPRTSSSLHNLKNRKARQL